MSLPSNLRTKKIANLESSGGETTATESEYYETTSDSEAEREAAEAASLLWERIGPSKTASAPVISVNDRRVSLSHLNSGSKTQEGLRTSAIGESSESNIEDSDAKVRMSDTEENKYHTIFELLDEVRRRKREGLDTGQDDRESSSKMWRRRLIVAILLNFLTRYRRKFVGFSELFLPAIISVVLISGMVLNNELSRQSQEALKFSKLTRVSSFDPLDQKSFATIVASFCSNSEYCRENSKRYYYIIYSPQNTFTDTLMTRVIDFLKIEEHSVEEAEATGSVIVQSKLLGVANSQMVEEECRKQWKNYENFNVTYGPVRLTEDTRTVLRYPVGVILSFQGGLISEDHLKRIHSNVDIPKTLSYTIRSFYAEVDNTLEGFPLREHLSTREDPQTNPYLNTGITALQVAIDLAFSEKIMIKALKDGDTFMKIGIKDPVYIDRLAFFRRFLEEPSLQAFEYPTYSGEAFRMKAWLSFTTITLLSYVVCDICLAQEIVHEQQRGSIELMKIHGITTSMRWVANLICTALLRFVSTLPVALCIHFLLTDGAIAPYPGPMYLWAFLWSHGVTATCFNYFITTGFGITKTEISGLVVVCSSFITAFIPLKLFTKGWIGRTLNIFLCLLFPQWNLANGFYTYLRFELYEEGLHWFDFPVLLDTDNHKILPLTFCINMFAYSFFLYLGLTVYMDHILPREFSPKEHWLFFLQPLTRKPPSHTSSTRPISKSQKPSVYENGPRDAIFGPRFRKVTLTTGSNKTVVLDNVSLDIYEGEVTCIVGQIGSGKSNLLNVVAGVSTPSSGFVDVKGLRVHDYHDITNRYVSLCPQKSLLMEALSVEDHVRLCCMLHGASYGKAKTQASELLNTFGLVPMRRHNYKGLTMSDTKKLMVAMALSKAPSVLLLDNPMDLLDNESTYEFWKLLQGLKRHRSIIVTCTKLEEAELYGDRIAVMCQGKLMCYGTANFLKSHYNLGNIISLTMVSKPDDENIRKIQNVMHSELEGKKTKLYETKGMVLQSNTLKFILPYGNFYSAALEKLEDNMEELNITKILMSQSSLWALFSKVSESTGIERVIAKAEVKILKGVSSNENSLLEEADIPSIPVKMGKSSKSFFNSAKILVLKKIWYYRQKYVCFLVAYIPQFIMLMQLVLLADAFLDDEPENVPKKISTRMYTNNYVLIRSADNEHTRDGWEDAFKYVLTEDNKDIQIETLDFEDDIESILATGQAHSLTQYKKQTIVAFGRDKEGHIGYYSSNSIHSAAIAAHIMMQSFIYILSPDRNFPYSTSFTSNPFKQYEGFPSSSMQSNSSTILGCFLALILTLMSAPGLRLVLTEQRTRFKMIQRMAGVSSFLYWFTHGMADALLYVFLIALSFSSAFFLDHWEGQQFTGPAERTTLLYIAGAWLCWAGIPYTYFISQVIPVRLTGYGIYTLLLFVFGVIPKVIMFQILRLSIQGIPYYMRYFFYLFPPYSLTSACVHYFQVVGHEEWCTGNTVKHTCEMYNNLTKIINEHGEKILKQKNGIYSTMVTFIQHQMSFNDTFRTCCKEFCQLSGTCHEPRAFFPEVKETVVPGLKEDFTALLVNGVIYWTLVITIEKRLVQGAYKYFTTKLCGNLETTVALRDVKTAEEPQDVKMEHQKVDYMVEIETDVDTEVYLVQDVTKFYAYTKGLDHVYFSVPINTLTGILGLPKSGRTTLLEIIAGQVAPSGGNVYKDNDLLENKSRNHLSLNVGYCPEKPCLLPYLTGAQMLTTMGRLRGLSATECSQHVQWWLKLFGMTSVANTKCNLLKKSYEQRLCCILALVGDTEVIILDDPTGYMDNMERYLFWNAITRIDAATSLKRTFIFTSDDAEEVQEHSSKVIVLDAGTVIAVGQLQEIFTNNNPGMLLAIRYSIPEYKKYTNYQINAKLNRLKDHVIQYLSPCALVDELENLLIYHLKDPTLQLSRVYAVMEGAAVIFVSILDHFHVYEQSLDDLILMLHKARNQTKADFEEFEEGDEEQIKVRSGSALDTTT